MCTGILHINELKKEKRVQSLAIPLLLLLLLLLKLLVESVKLV